MNPKDASSFEKHKKTERHQSYIASVINTGDTFLSSFPDRRIKNAYGDAKIYYFPLVKKEIMCYYEGWTTHLRRFAVSPAAFLQSAASVTREVVKNF